MAGPSNLRLKIKTDYVAATAVALAPLIYFWPALREGRVLSPDDGVIFNVPLRVAAANIIRSGSLPLWNPYIFCGLPLHGAAQAGLLFPLNWFYLIASPRLATNLMMLATYALAAVGAYVYSRRAGADLAGAVATSLIWQWCAFMVEQIGHTNILHTAALLPWLLWAIDGYLATGERKRGFLIAVLIALQVFAGHQQTLAYSLLLVAAYALVIARTAPERRKVILPFAIFMLAGLALAAVQILPTFELLRNSLRATATYEFFGSFSLPPRFILTFLAPYVLGGGNGLLFRAPYIDRPFFGEYAAYAGLLTMMLAAAALIFRRDTRTRFWGIVFGVALFMAIGRFMPLKIYQLLYHVPVLNLFRSPTRHLMEAHFALAVLAGRGLSVVRSTKRNALLAVTLIGVVIFLLVAFSVTWWRPVDFHLERQLPVTLLRAPELFLPVFIAALSCVSLWIFARSKSRRALIGLFAVLVLDLFIYGQGSAWRTHSPGPQDELWQVPQTVKFLRQREGQGNGSYRILTQEQPFDPSFPMSPAANDGAHPLALQPDIYMMQGMENAAGYDGFGLARYSRLAGDMKVWGELTETAGTLRGDSRALDLLNVRYLLTGRDAASGESSMGFDAATSVYGNQRFAAADLGLRPIKSGRRISFTVPRIEVDHIALLTNLAWSNDLPDHTVIAGVDLHGPHGETFSFELRAGDQTSEWAYDRPDIRARIKHKRAPVATSYTVEDANGKYEAHTYVCDFALPARTAITSGTITVLSQKSAPDLTLSIARLTLADGDKAFPLRRESITEDLPLQTPVAPERWIEISEMKDLAIFQRGPSLPRAWLAGETRVLSEPQILSVIRTGKLPDGQAWDPGQVALLEGPTEFNAGARDASARAAITTYAPNRVALKTKSNAPSILVLSENHYPGWRAYVDGRLVDTLRVDYNLRGVNLPAGEHEVEFVYRPKSVLIGAAISLLTLMGLIAWARHWLPEQRLARMLPRRAT